MTAADSGSLSPRPEIAIAAGTTQVLLLRHGESVEPPATGSLPLRDGQSDPPLSTRGVRQAEAVGETLTRRFGQVGALVSSGMARTDATLQPLSCRSGIPIVTCAGFREVRLGEWEGGEFRRRLRANDPTVARMRAEQRWDVIPGAEEAELFRRRCRDALYQVADEHRGGVVVVATHSGVIAELLSLATGSASFAFAGANLCSVSLLYVDSAGATTLGLFNDSSFYRNVE